MSCFLVTGGMGFIGSHLAAELVLRGHEVVVLDNLSTGSAQRGVPGAEFTLGSVTDQASVDQLFEAHRFAGVFHLAAFAAEAMSDVVKRFNYETNVIGSINLINACVRNKVGFFGFASSVAVYGNGRTPMRESDAPEPADSYGLSKLVIERELAMVSRTHGLGFAAFRMHNVYGEWQNMRDPYRNAVAIFLNQILRDEPLTVYGDGRQVRAFTYVHDIIPVLADAAQRPHVWGRAYNVGSLSQNTVLELAQAVARAMGVPDHPIMHLPSRDEVAAAYTDSTLARSVFDDVQDTPLAVGLARTADWARANGPVELATSLDIELREDSLPAWAKLVRQRISRESAG